MKYVVDFVSVEPMWDEEDDYIMSVVNDVTHNSVTSISKPSSSSHLIQMDQKIITIVYAMESVRYGIQLRPIKAINVERKISKIIDSIKFQREKAKLRYLLDEEFI